MNRCTLIMDGQQKGGWPRQTFLRTGSKSSSTGNVCFFVCLFVYCCFGCLFVSLLLLFVFGLLSHRSRSLLKMITPQEMCLLVCWICLLVCFFVSFNNWMVYQPLFERAQSLCPLEIRLFVCFICLLHLFVLFVI